MATRTANLQASASSLANFKNWATWVSGCFSAFGWVQTSDTGQVNWSTIASVPTYGTTVYEIWTMNDALQSTTPCYIKIEYANSNYTGPLILITVGGGSNGSGTITGTIVYNRMNPWSYPGNSQCAGDYGANTYACFASGDTNRISMLMWQSNSAQAEGFWIERSHNTAGADTAEYLIAGNASAQGYAYLYCGLGTLIGNQAVGMWLPSMTISNSSGSFNGTTHAMPIWPIIGQIGNPCLGALCAQAADVTEGSTCTVTHYGASHTYIATKQGSFTQDMVRSQNVAGAMLLRYE
jgi:hypothetical protein